MSLGLFTSLQIKEAATYGATESFASGTKFHIACKHGVNLEESYARIATEHTRQTGAPQPEEDALGLRSVEGSFEGVLPYSGFIGVLIKHLMGTSARSGTDPWTHTFTYNDKIYPGFSAAVRRGDFLHCYHGLQCNGFGLTIPVGAPCTWREDVLGSHMDIQALAAPTALAFPASGSPYLLGQRVAITFAGASLILTEISFEFKPTLEAAEDRSYKVGSDLRSLLVRSGLDITATIKRRHVVDGTGNGSKFWNRLADGATAAIGVTAAHDTLPGSYSLTMAWSAAKVIKVTKNVRDPGVVPEEISLRLFDFENTGTNNIVILDKNAEPAGVAAGTYDGEGA
jgi:hypothetical protein